MAEFEEDRNFLIIITLSAIIVISFWRANLQPKQELSRFTKKSSTIEYGYRKCDTHARVFTETRAHRNSKN